MNISQLESLLYFYKKSVCGQISPLKVEREIENARKALDKSFVLSGEEDETIKQNIDELQNIPIR